MKNVISEELGSGVIYKGKSSGAIKASFYSVIITKIVKSKYFENCFNSRGFEHQIFIINIVAKEILQIIIPVEIN